MGVSPKTFVRTNDIIIDHSQLAKPHPLWIIVVCKAKAVLRF